MDRQKITRPTPLLAFVLSLLVWVNGAGPTGVRVDINLRAVVVQKCAVGRGTVVRLYVRAVAPEVPADGLNGHSLTGGEQREQQNDGFHGVSFGLVCARLIPYMDRDEPLLEM
jgi:hypothetical protein